jgi:hypothetical protein
MGLQTYSVYVSPDPVSVPWTALTNVQNVNFSIGRQAQLDQVRAGTASIVLRYPTGYVSPVAALVAGSYMKIENDNGVLTNTIIWVGFVTDVVVDYGIPFGGGVGQADYATVSGEGGFARFGRMNGNDYVMAADTIDNQITNANTQTGLTLSWTSTTGAPLIAGTTVSSTWGDWVARVCQTTNARIREFGNATTIVSPFNSNVSTINFSDTTNDATNQVYNSITFDSLADNFYTQVTVTPESFGAATVTKSGATVPYRGYQTNTINASTAQATDYANYLLGNYGTARFAISSITCMAEVQNSFQLDNIGASNLILLSAGTQVAVAFRGTTYQCLIEGVNMSATPNGALYTFYLSGADLNAYLILGSTTFGTLNNNRLGY